MFKIRIVLIALFSFLCSAAFPVDCNYPSCKFDLNNWKLQIPGPKEIKDLDKYSSNYFYLTKDNEMCFGLDAEEQGHTKNSEYVRSELRHIVNWSIQETHEISAEIRVVSKAVPDKVTVLQIHGIMPDNTNAPPFLRIAVNNGGLYAFIKTENSGEKTESVLLEKNINGNFFKADIKVQDGNLSVSVNGLEKLNMNAGYWKYMNYFKAGCYPQAKKGNILVFFRSLSVK